MGHMVTMARSRSPFGEYEPCPHNPILTHRDDMEGKISGTGHADLIQAHDGSWWLVFLAFRMSEAYFHHLGRETFLAPVAWENGWPKVNGGKPITFQMDCETLPQSPVPDPAAWDDFQNGIGFHWNCLRNPDSSKYTWGPQGLTLTGTEYTLDQNASPTFLGRRQEQFEGVFRTHVQPIRIGEGAQAGVTAFYGPQNHYDFYLTPASICLKKTVGDVSAVVFEAPFAGECELEVRFDRLKYYFAYGRLGESKQQAGTALTRYVSTEATPCSFTGVYLGLYAQGDCQSRFLWAEYRNEPSVNT